MELGTFVHKLPILDLDSVVVDFLFVVTPIVGVGSCFMF